MREQVIEAIYEHKVIAILRGFVRGEALWLAKELYAGGIRIMELPFDAARPDSWEDTVETIGEIGGAFGSLILGAGTVLSAEQVEMTHAMGGQFIVSPDVNEEVIRRTRELDMVSLPGAMTPTEMMQAHRAGADLIKLFPAGSLGAGYLKAVRAPLGHLGILAVGGIGADNVAQYLHAGAVGAGVGGALVDRDAVARRDGNYIRRQAEALCRAARI